MSCFTAYNFLFHLPNLITSGISILFASILQEDYNQCFLRKNPIMVPQFLLDQFYKKSTTNFPHEKNHNSTTSFPQEEKFLV